MYHGLFYLYVVVVCWIGVLARGDLLWRMGPLDVDGSGLVVVGRFALPNVLDNVGPPLGPLHDHQLDKHQPQSCRQC